MTYEAPSDDAVMQEASGSDEREWPCLLRATGGNEDKKIKLSTVVRPPLWIAWAMLTPRPQVQPADYTSFTTSYGAVLKGAMTSLRKKRKQKRKPDAVKKAGASGGAAGAGRATFVPRLPKVVGPRRGAGAAKRDRAVKRRARELAKLVARKKRDRVV